MTGKPGKTITILNAPDDLVAVVWVTSNGIEYAMRLEQGLRVEGDPVMPLARRALSSGLRQLADRVDEDADAAGD